VSVRARAATETDVDEVVRLAASMYASIGQDVTKPDWHRAARDHFLSRLGRDLAVFVVDHPDRPGLAASAAGTVASRLPAPNNVEARVAYVQWVATDDDLRRRGYARAVMQALVDWYDGHAIPVIELHATPEGEPLYRELGFGADGPAALRRRR
jgi:GNAT superfamily N-acetyltransferase